MKALVVESERFGAIPTLWYTSNLYKNVDKDSYSINNPEQSLFIRSSSPAKYALELNSGLIEHLELKKGQKLKFKY